MDGFEATKKERPSAKFKDVVSEKHTGAEGRPLLLASKRNNRLDEGRRMWIAGRGEVIIG